MCGRKIVDLHFGHPHGVHCQIICPLESGLSSNTVDIRFKVAESAGN